MRSNWFTEWLPNTSSPKKEYDKHNNLLTTGIKVCLHLLLVSDSKHLFFLLSQETNSSLPGYYCSLTAEAKFPKHGTCSIKLKSLRALGSRTVIHKTREKSSSGNGTSCTSAIALIVQLQKQNPFFLYISMKSCKLFSISFEQTTSTKIQILTKKSILISQNGLVWKRP